MAISVEFVLIARAEVNAWGDLHARPVGDIFRERMSTQ